MVPLQEKIIYTVGPNILYVFNKWSEFISQVVRVYFTSGPSLLQKWREFKLNVYLFKYIIPQSIILNDSFYNLFNRYNIII